MKFKLKKMHIFLLLLFALIFCCCISPSFSTLEGLENTKRTGNRVDPNLNQGSNYDPNDNLNGDNSVVNPYQASTEEKIQSAVPASKMKAVAKSSIPKGDEDLYILKSQVVPPVCPKCPDVKKCDTKKDCPPCPAPQRCPEKPYECKMVPKYTDPQVSKHLPRPVLNSFDSFA